MHRLKPLLILTLTLIVNLSAGQILKPGIDKTELLEVMYVSARTGGSEDYVTDSNFIPEPLHHKMIYRSEEIGFYNLWELWISDSNTAIITFRGTTKKAISWMSNFYAAMLPAKGEIVLPDDRVFKYNLSDHPQAAVHTGWLISTAYLSAEIIPKIDSCYKTGIKDIIITGHSQGGALAYLMTAHLHQIQNQGYIPEDIVFKTYCTAAPKPGNLYFAYTYEQITDYGMAFNIVNPLDWVPESPVSIQTVNDYNRINPYVNIKTVLKSQRTPKRIALKHIYRKLKNKPLKAVKKYQKYLGKKLEPHVENHLGEIKIPDYYESSHYVRTGNSIVLEPDNEYHKKFTEGVKHTFRHHSHHAYIHLINLMEE